MFYSLEFAGQVLFISLFMAAVVCPLTGILGLVLRLPLKLLLLSQNHRISLISSNRHEFVQDSRHGTSVVRSAVI